MRKLCSVIQSGLFWFSRRETFNFLEQLAEIYHTMLIDFLKQENHLFTKLTAAYFTFIHSCT